MITLNMRAKSSLLAGAMIFSTFSATSNPVSAAANYLVKHPVQFTAIVAGLIAAKIRLDTRPKGEYNYTTWREDVQELLNSYNIFDAESRATIIAFIDKYFVGYPFKKYDTTTRTKLEDGSVFTLKGSKVVQFPSGAMGLVDAYVLQQMKGVNELLPVAAAFYWLLSNPYNAGEIALNKAVAVK